MKDAVCLLHLGNTWLASYQGQLRPVEAYPRLARPAWVIEDFGNAPAGQIRLPGKIAHAPALIERKVRNDGLVDGESRVLVHRQRKEIAGMQALYTAVPLTQWQQVSAWAATQKDHCLVLPLAALAAAGLQRGEGRVLRHGRQMIFFADTHEGYIYAAVTAYGDSLDDLIIAARSLGDQAHRDCGHGRGVSISWCPLSCVQLENEAEIILAFRAEDDCPVELCPLAPLEVDGHDTHSALPFLLERCSPSMCANPLPEKIAASAERLLPLSLAIASVMALGLFFLGGYAILQAGHETNNLSQLQQTIQQREASSRQLSLQTAPAEYPDYLHFVETLGAMDAAYNPARILSILKRASGNDARILRVRLDKKEGSKQPSLVVDGVLRAGVEPTALARFLFSLKTAGYTVTALDPAEGIQSGGFTYRLLKAPSSDSGEKEAT